MPGSELVRGAGECAEGLPEFLADAPVTKFQPEGLLIVHAGGRAGLFSSIIGGWVNGDAGSRPVTLEGTTMTRVYVDPTSERAPAHRERIARPASLDGLTIGLLDISKARGDVFLDQLEVRLRERGLRVERFRKPTFAKPAPLDLRHQIATTCDVVIEALAD